MKLWGDAGRRGARACSSRICRAALASRPWWVHSRTVGDVWQRLLVVLLHPPGAAGVYMLVLRPRLATTTILALAALLTANVIAGLALA